VKIFLRNTSEPKEPAHIINASIGENILFSCARAGLVMSAPCGGRQNCGKCKVQLLEGEVSGDTPDSEGWVRSCMAVPLTDISINVSSNEELFINEVSISTNTPENRRKVTRSSVAIDIGTTTVSARLIDADNCLTLDTISELNDQRIFGADIMSRINAAMNGKTNELFSLINRQTGRIISSFKSRFNLSSIEKLTVSGNTTMLHFFINTDPSSMGRVPFTPVFLEEKEIKGESLSLPVENISLLPSIAAFIGADITAALDSLDITNITGTSLLIDIGTNGEMALYDKGTIFCCSTAAGPAFEGAEISCGLGGVKGAISAVDFSRKDLTQRRKDVKEDSNFEIKLTTIGNVPPRGICGSGLIDAVALMLKKGIIDETGRLTGNGFNLTSGISITAADVRQFQLAKSAILSGIKILCKNAGLNTTEVKNVFIAGGLGFFINKQNAVSAGIFPQEFLDSIKVCGNLSLQGSTEYLTKNGFPARCRNIVKQCSIIDIASDPSFMDEFAENMLFNAP